MVVVQAEGCAPIVRAFEQGADRAEPWEDAHTDRRRHPRAVGIGDYLMLRAVRESGGTAISVTDDEILAAQKLLAEKAGIWSALEGAATVAALPYLTKAGLIARTDRVVLFNTAMGIKS